MRGRERLRNHACPPGLLDHGNLLRAHDVGVMWHLGADANRTDLHRAYFTASDYDSWVSLI